MPVISARLGKPRLSPHTSIILLMVLSLIGLDLGQCWVAHENGLDRAKTDTANLARSIAASAHETFTVADTVLRGLRERVNVDGSGPAAIARLENVMRMHVADQSLIRGLFLIDEHGAWLANSVPGTAPNLNYADREYFRHHRDVDDEQLLIGVPVRSKTLDGVWVIPLTHRISHPDGSFAGLVGATISAEVFQRTFRSFDIGKNGAINMTTADGHAVLVREPFVNDNVGRDVSESPVFVKFVDAAKSKSFEYVGLIDGLSRIGSFNRVEGFDLIVIVSRERDEVLAEWRRGTLVHVTWMAFALLALGLLIWRKLVLIRAAARNQALYRLLADNSSDAIVCLGPDGRRRYVSPSFWMMTGWTEAELLATSFSDLIVPEDQLVAAAAFAELRAGKEQVTAAYRYRCRDGTAVWVELLARPTIDPLTGLPVFVGNLRNISRQKVAEEQLAAFSAKLEATNAKLEAVSLTDSLTGIANRRHFDIALLKEWKRAARDCSDVALLLADADHFKAYNDLYGHQQGDACLQAIARTLVAGIRRPGDLAARYGGEEFAVILPGTSLNAAAVLADLMRQRLADQKIEHRGDDSGIVTISIGAAAFAPQQGDDPQMLIKLADDALYEAKRAGRNRVASADVATDKVSL